VGVDLRWAIGADSLEVDSAKPLLMPTLLYWGEKVNIYTHIDGHPRQKHVVSLHS
jgi:hypothetical protein